MSLNLDIPDAPRLRDKIAAGGLLVLVATAFVVGYWAGSGNAPVPERMTPAPEVRQADGSLILARQPDSTPAPAPHAIPKGSTEIRRITATVRPKPTIKDSLTVADCEPVTVTTSLVQSGDEIRAITSAEGGEVIGGLDLQIRPLLTPPAPRRWAAGASYEPVRGLWGVWTERDFGRLRVGAEINQTRFDDAEVRGRIGINF